ncbi:hypothetical protein PRIPAC_72031 [Pristionchus pacificus]|uniref:Uncharacterized protein n=1 Tax=Pristionchus pacificus TaxID=54126 RepID=A0A2A6CS21_PRIPA|nr:hypothetical protein PRIPAC_72031 [Pristionchus pacificus]|eukprot:PDM80898.1 hypothetical protein PRIPAC_35901 [Pristionchus pacificus]
MNLFLLLSVVASAVTAKAVYSGTCYYHGSSLNNLANNIVYETSYSTCAMTNAQINVMITYGNQWAQYGIQRVLLADPSLEIMRILLLSILLIAYVAASNVYSGTCRYGGSYVYENGYDPRPMTANEVDQLRNYGTQWSQYGIQGELTFELLDCELSQSEVMRFLLFSFVLLALASTMEIYSGTCRYDWAYVYETGYEPRPLTANEINQLKNYGTQWAQYGVQEEMCVHNTLICSMKLLVLLILFVSVLCVEGYCNYNNNIVTESGYPPRPMTQSEKDQMVIYGQQWDHWGQQISVYPLHARKGHNAYNSSYALFLPQMHVKKTALTQRE